MGTPSCLGRTACHPTSRRSRRECGGHETTLLNCSSKTMKKMVRGYIKIEKSQSRDADGHYYEPPVFLVQGDRNVVVHLITYLQSPAKFLRDHALPEAGGPHL